MRRALAAAAMLLATASSTPAQEATERSHVRGTSTAVDELLDEASAKSATVRGLIEALNTTDVVVYAEYKALPHLDGQLKFAGTSGGFRYVRIAIRTNLRRALQIPILAHELQHAYEVAGDPMVTTQGEFGDLFERIGYRAEFGFETEAARAAQNVAKSELALEALSPAATTVRH